uniref:Xylulose kinase-1 n=2 Tax=Tanacetum cinerariifolium TaxID=118510 RepID=A0A6L2K828_TANCI|nr:hypothetical protein [Tanacetum cinerariifolium]
MTLTFADTHNMIAYLTKSDVSEGFNQIIDFLNGSSIKYALTVNLNIYVLCIKQFWTSVVVKKVNDVMRLQALVEKKKVIRTEATITDALHLDDAEGIECLPNEDIFAELARMGYEKPSTKLTFYKAFFSSKWKFLIHTILQCMSAKRTSWNEFSSSMASSVICLSTDVSTTGVATEGDVCVSNDVVPTPVEELSIPSPTPPTPPPQPLQDQPLTSQVQLIPPQSPQAQPQSPQHQPQPLQDAGISMDLLQNLLDTCTTLTRRVKNLEHDKVAQALEITKLKQRVKKLEKRNKASKLQKLKKDVAKDVQDADIEESDNAVKRYQALKKKPQTKAQARKNMMIYIINVVGFKMDYFKGMTYDDIHPIFEKRFNSSVAFLLKTKEQMEEEDSRALKRLSESQEDKPAKKQKSDEEVKELRRHLQIVLNDEDDVYTKDTPLALKVLLVDYEIYTENNKPYYKIERANGSHQLYLSFLSMLRNFNREHLEVPCRIVNE